VRCAVPLLLLLGLIAPPVGAAGRMRAGDVHLAVERARLRVLVEDGLATTEVEQVFRNDSDAPAEAVYDYPLPDRAAFSGLSIWVGGQEIQGEVIARARAERVYSDVTGVELEPTPRARRHVPGPLALRPLDPALLQASGRRLRLRVAPVPARGTQRVRIRYVQPVGALRGSGCYVFPVAYEGVEAARVGELDCEVVIHGAGDVASPSHPVGQVERPAPGVTRFALQGRDVLLDRDLVVTFRRPERPFPEVEVLAACDGPDGTAQLTLTPWLPPDEQRAGRALLLVLDTSASMDPLRPAAHAALAACLSALGPEDRFELATLGPSARMLAGELRPLTAAARAEALAFARRAASGHVADPRRLSSAARALVASSPRPVDVVLITDAALSERPALLRALEQRARQAGVRVFALELGAQATPQAALARLARRTGGLACAVLPGEEAAVPRLLLDEVAVPALRAPSLRVEGVELTDVHPREPPAALRHGAAVQLYGRYARAGAGRAVLEGTAPSGRRLRWAVSFALPEEGEVLDVRRLWARAAADDIEDALASTPGAEETRRLEAELLRVSLAGPVLTPATSLLVLESEALFERYGIARRNDAQVGRERAAEARRRQAAESRGQLALGPGRGAWSGRSAGGGAGGPLLLAVAAAGLALARGGRRRTGPR